MTDEQLIKITLKIDDIIYKMVEQYQVHPLSFSAIVLARLKHLNELVDSTEDYNLLLESVITTKRQTSVTLQ
jgi:hypothetical protein